MLSLVLSWVRCGVLPLLTWMVVKLLCWFQQYHEDGARIEAAFRRYIHRADPKQKEDSYEIIVCHANVIRYFVCRFVFTCYSVHLFIFLFVLFEAFIKKKTFYKNHSSLSMKNECNRKCALITLYCYVCVVAKAL